MKGRVIKGVAGVYEVETEQGKVSCKARGKLRRDGEIYVGDFVELTAAGGKKPADKGVIDAVLPRANRLIRPYVSNVDVLCVVLAPIPEPDFLLADKLLAGCIQQGIEPLVCVNKIDAASAKFVEKIEKDYNGIAETVAVSALTGKNIEALTARFHGLVCLAGQSAAGKSSIINAVLDSSLETGAVSLKSGRGRHTTRSVEILKGDGFFIADTCGFSSLELPLVEPKEISALFVDFEEHSSKCKFRGCSHIDEPDCAVKEAVEKGLVSRARYDRYKALYNQAKENWRKRYE